MAISQLAGQSHELTWRHFPFIRLLLREVYPAGTSDLGRISQDDVTRYIERREGDVLGAALISPIPPS
jgi:hypothetical protein